MTLQTYTNKINYLGDSALQQFSFAFTVLDPSHLQILLNDILQSGGYVITLNADQSANPGGYVTFDVAPRLDTAVTLLRVVPETQLIDYPSVSPFPVDTHELGFDKLTMMIQQLQEQAVRTIGVQPSDPGTVDLTLPPYDPGKLIGWCPDEQKLCNLDAPACPDPYVDPYRQIYGRVGADGTVLKKGGNVNFTVAVQSTGVYRITFAEDITEDYVVVVGQASSGSPPGWGSTSFVTSELPDGFTVQTQDDESGANTTREFTFHVVWDVAA